MIKKELTFTDFDDNKVTETWYFHVYKSELAEMKIVEGEGLEQRLKAIIETNDATAILAEFRKLIALSVGTRPNDGKQFIKTPDITSEFMNTPACDELLFELYTDASAGVAFINGITSSLGVPQATEAGVIQNKSVTTVDILSSPQIESKTSDDYTDDELVEMGEGEFYHLFNSYGKNIPKRMLTLATRRKMKQSAN